MSRMTAIAVITRSGDDVERGRGLRIDAPRCEFVLLRARKAHHWWVYELDELSRHLRRAADRQVDRDDWFVDRGLCGDADTTLACVRPVLDHRPDVLGRQHCVADTHLGGEASTRQGLAVVVFQRGGEVKRLAKGG